MPLKIVSGGQTGVDRAALDTALALGLAHGGWCPKGRRAEDGRIDDRYQLVETEQEAYEVRTERNVMDSDGTLILYRSRLHGGTALTRSLAIEHEKPLFCVDLDKDPSPDDVLKWIAAEHIQVLNVAGPRVADDGGDELVALTEAFLRRVLLSFASNDV